MVITGTPVHGDEVKTVGSVVGLPRGPIVIVAGFASDGHGQGVRRQIVTPCKTGLSPLARDVARGRDVNTTTAVGGSAAVVGGATGATAGVSATTVIVVATADGRWLDAAFAVLVRVALALDHAAMSVSVTGGVVGPDGGKTSCTDGSSSLEKGTESNDGGCDERVEERHV